MPTLHNDAHRAAIVKRVAELRRDSVRRWGTMSVDQMLWHVNEALAVAMGQKTVPPLQKTPLPRPVMKFLVLNLPWPRGAPTLPAFVAARSYDFDRERDRCLQLVDAFAAKKLDDEWPLNPVFGRISGADVSRLHAKHLNHHLSQFSA